MGVGSGCESVERRGRELEEAMESVKRLEEKFAQEEKAEEEPICGEV